jgi:predicted anti-sigma-YlaC factor YlaD
MKCKTVETWVLRSLDGRLDERSQGLLAEHLKDCPSCRKLNAHYRSMLRLLREGHEPAPLPGFWARLEPRLREERKVVPLILWERWCLRAIPVFLVLAVLTATMLVVTPQAREMSQSEALLLENANPISETRALFEEQRPEARNMMLIFASLETKPVVRR